MITWSEYARLIMERHADLDGVFDIRQQTIEALYGPPGGHNG